MDVIGTIKEVIELEKRSLEDLLAAVDDRMLEAIELIRKSGKKIILCGMGKSGHIAGKIAATLCSTGTTAVCLHPGEALHGDLGIIDEEEIVMLLSKSGESDELIGMIPSLRRMKCKIISITANQESTLARNSDVVLYTPIEKEACSLNLAPTCSTTAALVLGDALAVALMKLNDFSRQEFALYHPAGRLGKRLLFTVNELMNSGDENPVVRWNAEFDLVLDIVTKGMMNAVSVTDDEGRFIGLITGFDLRKAFREESDIKSLQAHQIMFNDPTTIKSGSLAVDAFELMKNSPKPLNLLPVLEDGIPVGIVSLYDMIKAGL